MDVITYSNWQFIKDLWVYVKPFQKKFWIGSFMRLTSDIVWLFPIWGISEIITFATEYQVGEPITYFWWLTIGIWAAGIYHVLMHDWCKYFIYQVAENASLKAQLDVLRHMIGLDFLWHQQENSGNKIKKISRGGEYVNQVLRLYVDLVVESTVNLLGMFVIFGSIGWEFVSFFGVYFLIACLVAILMTKRAANQAHIVNVESEKYDGMVFEVVNNVSTVKSLGLSRNVFPFLENIRRRLVFEIKKRIFWFRSRGVATNFVNEFFRQLIILYTVFQVFNQNLEVGTIALVLLYFNKVRASAYELSAVYHRVVLAKIAILRMKEIADLEPEIENQGTVGFAKDWQELTVKNLDFGYEGRKVLANFDLTVKRGEKIGIVGISGAGKSTLFKLLLKLVDGYSGDILFDGVKLRDIRRKDFVNHVAVVPQETELFNFSLKGNIVLAGDRKNIDQKALEEALKVAHVNDFMDKLPEGVDTLIGEKGVKLSGGEKQRVGIARAVYRGADLLLLDEATSHLDVDSEKKIQDALHQCFENVTAIVIAHRLSTLKEMDRIVVMKDGKIIEEGSFEELVKMDGKFAQLWAKQMKG